MASEKQDPKTLYLYTSLTSGSSTIITATARMEGFLKAHKVPFKAIDVATDDRARSIWTRRRTAKQTLPALVKDGEVLGSFSEVEEWVEFGELKWKVGLEPAPGTLAPAATTTTIAGDKSTAPTAKIDLSKASPLKPVEKKEEVATPANPLAASLAAEAAAAAKKKKDDALAAAKAKVAEATAAAAAKVEKKEEPKAEPKEDKKEETAAEKK
ncbi:hypothetical protein ABW19_dt0202937 [Dactylella cylindrospora]|nr:hypothetical protein ABW19_dt0202937 [Dactylella cylindrospora]